jgi:Flp pilus assembly CpaF family ATPase
MAAQVQRQQDVLVPEDVEFRAAAGLVHRIDRGVAEVGATVQRAHPVPDGRRRGERPESDGEW